MATTSANSTAASGCVSEATATTALPADQHGRDAADEAGQRRLLGARTATTPVGSGMLKLKYGPATGFEVPTTCDDLVGEAGVPDEPMNGPLDLRPGRCRARRE